MDLSHKTGCVTDSTEQKKPTDISIGLRLEFLFCFFLLTLPKTSSSLTVTLSIFILLTHCTRWGVFLKIWVDTAKVYTMVVSHLFFV